MIGVWVNRDGDAAAAVVELAREQWLRSWSRGIRWGPEMGAGRWW